MIQECLPLFNLKTLSEIFHLTYSMYTFFRFLFSESTKLTSVGGEKALAAMIAGLSESVEREFGVVSARLFGVFKQVSDSKWCHQTISYYVL